MIRKSLAVLSLLAICLGGAFMTGWTAMGTKAGGERLERMAASPQWRSGHFFNELRTSDPDMLPTIKGWYSKSNHATPAEPLPTVARSAESLAPMSELGVTWFGHSTLMVDIDGKRFLIDPVWGARTAPFSWVGPKRFHDPVAALSDLPKVDAVLISHDHYDHLDFPTITALAPTGVKFIVPLGIGAHLEYWGVSSDQIAELDWWQELEIDGVRLVSTPSRHFSGRSMAMTDRNHTLWTGWAMIGPKHRAYYSGDTSMFPGFKEIGERLGPFDVTMIESGAYNQLWADVHLGPEQAVAAHRMVRGNLMIPVHWGTFDLSFHGWTEPVERILAESARTGVAVATPRIGESVIPAQPRPPERWWPETPWETAEQSPVESSLIGDLVTSLDG